MRTYKQNRNYLEVAAKYISDTILAKQIQTNLDFIEKYLDAVDLKFDELKEKQIVYKQLGIMAFSCAEALWKSLVYAINKHCEERQCKKNCPYRKYQTKKQLNLAKPKEILEHLSNTRLLNIFPFEMDTIEEMQELRNHIHLTRTLIDGDQSKRFNRQFVDSMLRLYYVTLNLLEINNWYFQENKPCLSELDMNAYNDTAKKRIEDNKRYVAENVCYSTSDLFYNKQIKPEKERILQKLSRDKEVDISAISESVGRWLYYAGAQFCTDDSYKEAVDNYYKKLSRYLSSGSKLIGEIEKKREYYCDLFRIDLDD